MQLRELNELAKELQYNGVSIHAISAETGGDEEIKKRLAERESPIDFPVHSDPDHKLLIRPLEDIYVVVEHKASKYGGTYEDYKMVQPAMIVVKKTGEIQQMWSWKTAPLDQVEPKTEMTSVDTHGGLPLVGVRPLSTDLWLSIKEDRNIKLSGKTKMQIMSEGIAQDGFCNTMSRAMSAMCCACCSK